MKALDELMRKCREDDHAPTYKDLVELKSAIEADRVSRDVPAGIGGGLVAIRTLLIRDPCAHATTAIAMIDVMLAAPQPQPAQSSQCEWTNCPRRVGDVCCNEQAKEE